MAVSYIKGPEIERFRDFFFCINNQKLDEFFSEPR